MENVEGKSFEEAHDFLENEYTHEEAMYANSGGVLVGDNDFMMILETGSPFGLTDRKTIMMTPRMTKSLAEMLSNAVKNYEEVAGEIYMDHKVNEKLNESRE